MDENRLIEMEKFINRLKIVFPPEMLSELERNSKKFWDEIRSKKPKTIISNKAMNEVLKLYPNMKANQIDDFLLEKGIGDEKALKDFLELEKLNRENKPLIKDDKDVK
ncbi:MAG TPA: hypothetical protein VLE02_02700 [Nitrosarchaeum sp.]|nr:hypothetical protein [Nitrosarchaeum sp.]